MIDLINKLNTLIKEYCTVVAPGKQFTEFVNSNKFIKETYDLDRFLEIQNYTIADFLFDNIIPQTNLIVTLHAEYLYPVNELFPSKKHILCIETSDFYNYCTNETILDRFNFKKTNFKSKILYWNF